MWDKENKDVIKTLTIICVNLFIQKVDTAKFVSVRCYGALPFIYLIGNLRFNLRLNDLSPSRIFALNWIWL